MYRRYAGLYFCACIDAEDNELAYLEAIHLFVEILDAYFENVCELDLVFYFYQVRAVLDEVFLALTGDHPTAIEDDADALSAADAGAYA